MDQNTNISREEKRTKIEEIQRIAISKEAQIAITEIMDKVNEGFLGGKVTRMELANWALIHLKETISDDQINQIRMEHFDEVTLLEVILRKAKEKGKIPEEFKDLLQKQFGSQNNDRKKLKKALTSSVTNGHIDE
jgi:hypothetical protein